MKKKYLFLFLLVLTSLYSVETITVLRGGEWAPFHFSTENSQDGLLIEILDSVSERSGIRINYEYLPSWTRCLENMKSGKSQAFMPLFKTEERMEYMYYFDEATLFYDENVLVSLNDDNLEYSGDLSVLSDFKIGMVKDYSYGVEFDNADYLNKFAVENEEMLLTLLHSGKRYDYIVGNNLVITDLAKKMGILEQLKFHEPYLYKAPLYIAFSKKSIDKKLAKKFSVAIKEFLETDSFKKIVLKYK